MEFEPQNRSLGAIGGRPRCRQCCSYMIRTGDVLRCSTCGRRADNPPPPARGLGPREAAKPAGETGEAAKPPAAAAEVEGAAQAGLAAAVAAEAEAQARRGKAKNERR